MNSSSWNVIISGAGIIGVSLALELRGRGAQVLVLDSGTPGREASSAAAGMLAPADPMTPPALRPLAMASAELFPAYVQKLEAAADMQVDFRQLGTIELSAEAAAPHEYKGLSPADLQRLEPSLKNHARSLLSEELSAFFVQEDSVDPHLLMQAALAAAKKLGVEIRGNTAVTDIHSCNGQIEVLGEVEGRLMAKSFVNCQGAWAGAPVRPRKGQMLYLQPQTNILRHVLRTPEIYIVPRSTGKVLIGATVEDVGFDKSVEPEALDMLLTLAKHYLPELAAAPIMQSWAGLRPGTPDDLPIIGATDIQNVFIASGHFRNGILLAPITAKIMADLIEGRTSSLDISPFSPARFSVKTV
ncbi:MAG TPA: glycine oxidase ThiO [Candidatus Angelobacter sp.]